MTYRSSEWSRGPAYFIDSFIHLDNLLDAVVTIATHLAAEAWCVQHKTVLNHKGKCALNGIERQCNLSYFVGQFIKVKVRLGCPLLPKLRIIHIYI